MNASSEARLTQVYPLLSDKIHQLAEQLGAEGITIIVVQGLRTVAEQQALYEQGRTTPGKIVTNCPGGHSWHNFGLAVDCAPLEDAGVVDWNASHPAWQRMEQLGVGLGLVAGALWRSFPDAPHFQLTGAFGVNPDDNVRALYDQGGLAAVWSGAFPADND